MFGLNVAATLLAATCTVVAIPPMPVAEVTGPMPTEVNVSLPIDHFNSSDSRRYNNRYWFEDRYYKPGGPVFFYDAGESPFSLALAASVLEQSTTPDYISAVNKLAQFHNGLAVAWEHRYFGYSLPCPLGPENVANVTADCDYQYLTIDQALEDIVYFANNPNFPGYNETQLASLAANNSPWVFIGGSYPGARAAWLRARNPETIYASWASSAVVAPLEDGSSYYNTQARTRDSNCTTDMNDAILYIDNALGSSDPAVALDMRKRIATTLQAIDSGNTSDVSAMDANSYSNEDLAPLLVEQFDSGFQESGPIASNLFCSALESFDLQQAPEGSSIEVVLGNNGEANPTDNGLKGQGASDVQLAYAFLYASYAPFRPGSSAASPRVDIGARGRGIDKFAKPVPVLPRDDEAAPASGFGDGSNWFWIVQSEFGVYEASSEDYFKLKDGRVALSHWENQTSTRAFYYQFFEEANIKNVPEHPNITECLKYGGWNMNPSNVMWTTGTWDPWRPYTPLNVDQELGAPVRVPPTTKVPACNVAPDPSTPFGIVYPEGLHAHDLRGYSNDTVAQGVAAFHEALLTWLPCFKPH